MSAGRMTARSRSSTWKAVIVSKMHWSVSTETSMSSFAKAR